MKLQSFTGGRALGLAIRYDGMAPPRVFTSTGFTEAACILTKHSPGFLTGFGLEEQETVCLIQKRLPNR